MSVPAANLAYGASLSAASDDLAASEPTGACLHLHPGEPTELLLRLRNESDHSLRFSLRFSSTVPADWCLTPLDAYELASGQRREVALVFQAPSDFFETLIEVAPATRRPLNYSGRLDIYSHTLSGELTGITSESVSLMVRPTSLYASLLPQVYQEIDLVGRLMAIVEQTFRPDVETWNTLWAHFDPLIAPQAMLGFLAHWVGWRSLPQLSWQQQRKLIRRAIELYAWRGTAYGLRLFLHLATGLPFDDDDTPESQKHISIVEPSQQGAVFGESVIGEGTVFGGGKGFHFTVVLRSPTHLANSLAHSQSARSNNNETNEPVGDVAIDETLVRTIIERERPAFCTYELSINPPS